jgi:hypothetical protein
MGKIDQERKTETMRTPTGKKMTVVSQTGRERELQEVVIWMEVSDPPHGPHYEKTNLKDWIDAEGKEIYRPDETHFEIEMEVYVPK